MRCTLGASGEGVGAEGWGVVLVVMNVCFDVCATVCNVSTVLISATIFNGRGIQYSVRHFLRQYGV